MNGTPVAHQLLAEETDSPSTAEILKRADYSSLLCDYCSLYFATEDQKGLSVTHRPVSYRQAKNPRNLLIELSKGPLPQDSQSFLVGVMPKNSISDTDMLGFSLSDETLLVNFSPSFVKACEGLSAEEERLLAYSLVNTLCSNSRIKNVCFFLAGSQFDGLSGEIYWAGLFYPLPT